MSFWTDIRDVATAPVRVPIKAITKPKEFLTDVRDLGESIRSTASPYIGMLNDVRNALAPRIDFGVDLGGRVDVGTPDPVRVVFPQFDSPSFPQPRPMMGDATGGFLANLATDFEQLRYSRRRLQFLRHVLGKGQGVDATDTL